MMGSRPNGHCLTYWLVGAINCTSSGLVAVMVPSALAVYPVDVVVKVNGKPDVGVVPNGSRFTIPAATWAVTVAATVPVSISSQAMGVAAAEPSNEIPHSTTLPRVAVVPSLTWSIVLIAVPVVTFTSAAVVGEAPLAIRYNSA